MLFLPVKSTHLVDSFKKLNKKLNLEQPAAFLAHTKIVFYKTNWLYTIQDHSSSYNRTVLSTSTYFNNVLLYFGNPWNMENVSWL